VTPAKNSHNPMLASTLTKQNNIIHGGMMNNKENDFSLRATKNINNETPMIRLNTEMSLIESFYNFFGF